MIYKFVYPLSQPFIETIHLVSEQESPIISMINFLANDIGRSLINKFETKVMQNMLIVGSKIQGTEVTILFIDDDNFIGEQTADIVIAGSCFFSQNKKNGCFVSERIIFYNDTTKLPITVHQYLDGYQYLDSVFPNILLSR